jgi:hypothetical protein
MTMISLVFILALVGAVGYAGVRLFPVYLNYMKVVSTLRAVARESKGGSDEASVRAALARHWNIEDITGIDYRDVEIKKEDGDVTLHAAYDDKVPYVANVSLMVSFDTSVKIE